MSEHKDIAKLSDEQKLFILEEKMLKPNFFGFWHRQQVSMGETWMLYRDGALYRQLQAGPHVWWTGFFHEWKIQRINLNIELIPIEVKGRVRGPSMAEATQLAGAGELACEVTARLGLSCGISKFQAFLRYRDPLSVFLASVSNMVNEMIGELPYDQYGQWATRLRDAVKRRLQSTDDSELLIGMRVEEVYVTAIEPNTKHDRSTLEMYQLVERTRRELAEAQANRKRDKEVFAGYAEQADLVEIAPSIIALQNSPIGKALIERDADLKKLMVAAGLNPGVNVQPISDPQGLLGQGPALSVGYLPPARQSRQLSQPRQPSTNSGSLPSSGYGSMATSSGSLFPPMDQSGRLFPTGNWSVPPSPTPPPAGPPIDTVRQEQEVAVLNAAGYGCAGKGQNTPTFDSNGQPIPGSTEWVLEAYKQYPTGGYLALIFHCPMGYPMIPPRVQMRPPSGGGMRWIEPNVVKTWNPSRMLVEIAREIDDITPD